MSQNPFQAPRSQPTSGGNWNALGRLPGRAYVNQIQVISILMLIQGVMLFLMSLLTIFYAVLLGNDDWIFAATRQRFPPEAQSLMMFVASLLGGFVLLLSLMHFLAGYWGLHLKGRMFGIVTMILGLGAALTIYCAPTAIGLAIYGLAVYFNGAAQQAFGMRNAGKSKAEILNLFE